MGSPRSAMSLAAALAVVLAAVPLHGCGWLFVHAPPEGHERLPYFTCTEESTLPTLDGIFAGLALVGTVVAATSADEAGYGSYGGDTYSAQSIVVGGIAEGLVFGLSAASGARKVRECREAKRQWLERTYPQAGGSPPADSSRPR
jgi:hypothetical protein